MLHVDGYERFDHGVVVEVAVHVARGKWQMASEIYIRKNEPPANTINILVSKYR